LKRATAVDAPDDAASTGFGQVAEELVWEKLRALRAGADLATKRLL